MINVCLKCAHSKKFHKPISMTTGNHLHLLFECAKPAIPDAYGYLKTGKGRPRHNPMILDLVTNESWVDGSNYVPEEGCANFVRDKLVGDDVV
jgi:hypothetical protein